MFIRISLAIATAALSSTAIAQTAPPAAAPAPKDDMVRVALDTAMGRIVVALDATRAPITTANFLHYVDSKKLEGEGFYRAMPYGKGGLIQGGITTDGRKVAKPIAHEPTSKTGIKHVAGTISMAASAPGSATSDFFILTTDVPAFDDPGSGGGFAAFGRVVEGMDVVQKILAAPVSPTKGLGAMKGQMLEPVVRFTKVGRME